MRNGINRKYRLYRAIAGVGIAISGVFMSSADAAWMGAATGTTNDASHDYNNTANWLGSTIDDTFSNALAGATTLYLSAARTTGSSAGGVSGQAMSFAYTGAYGLTLQGGGTNGGATAANHTLTVAGDVYVNAPSGQTVTLGSTTANSALNLDLGGATRTLRLPAGSSSASNYVRILTLKNNLSNGGLNVEAGGLYVPSGIVYSTGSTVNIQGTTDYAGLTTVRSGNLYINDAGGSALNSSGFVVNRTLGNFGVLQLGSLLGSTNRIGDSASVTLNSGRLDLQGQNNAATTETFGTLQLNTGVGIVNAAASGASGSATLTASSLSRNYNTADPNSELRATGVVLGGPVTLAPYLGTVSATMNLGGAGKVKLADSGASLALVGGGNTRTTDKSIVPYLISGTTNTAGRANTLVTYDSTNGFVPLAAGDYVINSGNAFPTVNGDGNDNVRLSYINSGGTATDWRNTTVTNTLSGSATVNALVMDVEAAASSTSVAENTFTLTGTAGQVLTLKSGVLLATSTGSSGAANGANNFNINNVTLALADREGVIQLVGGSDNIAYNTLAVNGPVTGTKGLTVTGYSASMWQPDYGGVVNLAGNNSGLSGPITVNGGHLQVAAGGATGGVNPTSALRVRDGASFQATATNVTVASVQGAGVVGYRGSVPSSVNIGGTGTGGTTGSISLLGGSISPGDIADGSNPHATGRLTFRNMRFNNDTTSSTTVLLKSGSLNIDLDSMTAFDSVYINSYNPYRAGTLSTSVLTINNGANGGAGTMDLNVTLGFVPEVGSLFKIIEIDQANATVAPSLTGQFSNTAYSDATTSLLDVLYGGGTYHFSVLYGTYATGKGDVTLRLDSITVPEPATFFLLGLTLLGSLSLRRRAAGH